MYKYISHTHVTAINIVCHCGLWEQTLLFMLTENFNLKKKKKKYLVINQLILYVEIKVSNEDVRKPVLHPN